MYYPIILIHSRLSSVQHFRDDAKEELVFQILHLVAEAGLKTIWLQNQEDFVQHDASLRYGELFRNLNNATRFSCLVLDCYIESIPAPSKLTEISYVKEDICEWLPLPLC